jgi:hypothetical protein
MVAAGWALTQSEAAEQNQCRNNSHTASFCMSDVLRRKTQTCRVTVAFLYLWSARSGLVGKGRGKRLRFLCALISALRKKKKINKMHQMPAPLHRVLG